jgi:hypothetical protein
VVGEGRGREASPSAACYDFQCQESPTDFLGLLEVFSPRGIDRAGASKRRRVSLLLCVGWLPPDWRPSGAGLTLGTSRLYKPPNTAEDDTTPGRRLCRCTLASCRIDRLLSFVPSRAGVI